MGLSGMGFDLAASVGVGALLGWWIDGRFDTEPWGVIVCSTIGIVGGLLNFVRGAQRLTESRRQQLLEEVRLTLKVDRSRVRFEIPVPLGKAGLSEDTYLPVFDALADGPMTLGELFALPALRRAKNLSPVTAGNDHLGAGTTVAQTAADLRFAETVVRHALHGYNFSQAAS